MNTESLVQRVQQVIAREAGLLPADYLTELFAQQIADLSAVAAGCGDGFRRVLLIGGGGYIGTIMARHLVDAGYAVRCSDACVYGHGRAVHHLLDEPGYQIAIHDLTRPEGLDALLEGISDVIILAGLVGDPITKKYPEASEAINSEGLSRLLARLAERENLRRCVFISTCSNYGLMPEGERAHESSPLQPLSLYARAKVDIEQKVLALNGKAAFTATVLRFATAFGLSPRMRFDLTVNQFTRDLALGRRLVIFDAHTWRPYCHVQDFATLVRRVIEAPEDRIAFQVFNAGGDDNNSTKASLVDIIRDIVPGAEIEYQDKGPDPRDYRVDFSKVRETLHFTPSWSIRDGVNQIAAAMSAGLFHEDDSLYGNYDLTDYLAGRD